MQLYASYNLSRDYCSYHDEHWLCLYATVTSVLPFVDLEVKD